MHGSRLQQESPAPSVTKIPTDSLVAHKAHVSPTDRQMDFVSTWRRVCRLLPVTGLLGSRSSDTGCLSSTVTTPSSQHTCVLWICRTRFTKSAGYQCPYQSPTILHVGVVSSGDGESPDIISNHNYVQLTPSCCAQDKLTPLTYFHSPFFTKHTSIIMLSVGSDKQGASVTGLHDYYSI